MSKLLIFLFLMGWSVHAQHQDKVDFINAQVEISPLPAERKIYGTVQYRFDVLEKVDSVFFDAKNINVILVKLDSKKISFKNDGKRISIHKKFKKDRTYTVSLQYSCIPKQTVYFLGWDDTIAGNEQIWTQGQGKYTSHWLPSFDDMREKVEFDLKITFKSDYEVIANGNLVNNGLWLNSVNENEWIYDMQKPMSSYLLAFAVGEYDKQVLKSKSGIPIENYFYPGDSLRVEPTYRYTKQIFDFLETEIGVPYPWQNYKQVPVHDFLYAGMENTTATIFSDGYVIDSTAFVDKNYVNVNAHELAHQWFGNLVTEKDGDHHWLHEGFATYYAYLAEKEIFGNDHFYWKLYKSAVQLKNEAEKGNGQRLTDPKASSLIFYEKGALALFMLRDLIGEANFKTGIKNYLKKHQFDSVAILDFLVEMEQTSGISLSDYKNEWLENTGLPFENIKTVLGKSSESLRTLFEMENEFEGLQSDDLDYGYYWDKTNSVHLKKYIVEQHHNILPDSVLNSTFASDTIPIRQALATSLFGMSRTRPLTDTLRLQFETLLNDKSYVTIENALVKLWMNFPGNRVDYLNRTKGCIGLPNKNIRLLWLALAILTDDFETKKTQDYFLELSGYTASKHSWETRMTAFSYLKDAAGLNDTALLNLLQSSGHHSWQFKKFTRNLLDELLKDDDYTLRIEKLSQKLKGEELRYINGKLNK
ncbi:M1 family metallopeptidase [Costertonia aggregata]|uniref:Aminopeptidase N n=1 Tax=Costertonia aggregata TaxID=343403 RepID=A0A7H9AU84_9FLAO|nr:M1 family metallopeptidase [Costertonia aggregata]QLG46872.1 M1 family metallopeptidase [Costertonia aggregata]